MDNAWKRLQPRRPGVRAVRGGKGEGYRVRWRSGRLGRWLAWTALLVLVAALGAACGRKQEPSTGGQEGTQTQPVEIRLSGWASSPAETRILEELLQDFQAKNPDVKVKYEPVTGDFFQKLQTDFGAQTEPDVFYVDVFWAQELIQRGLLLDLTPYIEKDAVDLSDFEPSLLAGFQSEGKTYGLPKGYSTLGLFYNKQAFAEAGVAAPPANWDELVAVARKLTTKDRKGLAIAPDHARFVPFIYQAGGRLFSEDKKQAYFNSPEAVQAATFYTGLVTREKVADTPQALGVGWAGDAFAEGKAAMVLEGHWMIPFLKDKNPNLQYGVAELPAGPNGQRGNFVYTVAYGASARTKHPEAAWKLINYLTSVEGQTKNSTLGLELPSRKSVAAQFESDELRKPLIAGAAYAVPFQYTPGGQPYVDELNKALERMILEGADPKAELDQVQQKFEEVAGKGS